MTIAEAAGLWGVTERAVRTMCQEGKIAGARKEKNSWFIPEGTSRPEDSRVKTGTYIKSTGKTMPVGISDYVRTQSEYYYVDKTLLIKEFLDRKSLVTLFTRPRRFGKTLNMDMLRVFFEKSNIDTSIYFKDKEISKFESNLTSLNERKITGYLP